jgi:predicted ATP-binding protein involved in virulence
MIDSEKFEIKLKRLALNDFRGFSKLQLEFDNSLTVFIGENGSGKTTILDALAGFLDFFILQIYPRYKFKYDRYSKADIKNDSEIQASVNELEFSVNEETLRLGSHFTDKTDLIVRFEEPSQDWSTEFLQDLSRKEIVNQTEKKPIHKINLPIIVYYPSLLIEKKQPEKSTLDVDKYSNYDDSLSGYSLNFEKFKEWFRWQQNIETEEGDNKLLSFIKKAILQILNDDSQVFSDIRISWKNKEVPEGEMAIKKGNSYLYDYQLSSGEKSLLTKVGDLARRLCIANRHLDNPHHGKGIVLIDEIDTHLHPKWQRKIIPKLREIFPNIQFVVTTHSPMVVQNLDKENIRILREGNIIQSKPVKGRDINSVSFDIFGVEKHPIEQQDLLNLMRKCFDLIDEGKTGDAKSILAKLIEVWGEEDGNIVELKTLIDLSGGRN